MTTELITKLQKQCEVAYKNLTADQGEALNAYTLGKHEDINRFLSTKSLKDEYVLDYVNSIDKAIPKFKLENNIIVFKGTKRKYYIDKNGEGIKGFIKIPVYLSTSVKRHVALGFKKMLENEGEEETLLLKICVPSGTPGIYIGEKTGFLENQYEFLLHRGLKYRVIEWEENTLKLEVITAN